jgi:hypothetical protein
MTVYSNPPVDWLLTAGDAWVRYCTRRDLLRQPDSDPVVQAERAAMLDDPRVRDLIARLHDWPGEPLSSHKKAGHALHILSFLAEIGVRVDDPGMADVAGRIITHQSPEGAFQIVVKISASYGGSDEPTLNWMLCDAPLVLWAVRQIGAGDDLRVTRAVDHLARLLRANGWPCATQNGFRGPGHKDDPCPYANLLALKALADYPVEPAVTAAGIASLLWAWEVQKEHKPYLFGVGTDFRKPKFPLVWYDLLHVVDVLSRFPTARADARYQAMLAELMAQANSAGQFTPASMYQDWKGWEFANKKAPSPAITLIAWRAALR